MTTKMLCMKALATFAGAAGLLLPAQALDPLCSSGPCSVGPEIEAGISASATDVYGGETVTITVTASDEDLCGDPAKCPDAISTYSWSGATGSGNTATLTVPPYESGGLNEITVTCTVDDAATYADDAAVTVEYTITILDPATQDEEEGDGLTEDEEEALDQDEGGSGEDDGPCPEDDGGGCPPSFGDPVLLATGQELYKPAVDMTVYNPYGSPVSFRRTYFSGAAKKGYGSPGLPPGWLHEYDYRLVPLAPSIWGDLSYISPNGAKERLRPSSTPTAAGQQVLLRKVNSAGNPVTGTPFVVTGTSSGTTGLWSKITVARKDGWTREFAPVGGHYLLSGAKDRFGNRIAFDRDNANRICIIKAATNAAATTFHNLMEFHYAAFDGAQYIDSVMDVSTANAIDQRLITYRYDVGSDLDYESNYPPDNVDIADGNPRNNRLRTVSQVKARNPDYLLQWIDTGDRYTYRYSNVSSRMHLASITVPSQAGTGTATAKLHYQSDGKVKALEDGNGNLRRYEYQGFSGSIGRTRVDVYSPGAADTPYSIDTPDATKLVDSRTSKYNASKYYVGTERTHSVHGTLTTQVAYDTVQTHRPREIWDEKGRRTALYAYDSFGNVEEFTDIRGTKTTYGYDYPTGLPGRLRSVTVAGKPPVNYDYNTTNSYVVKSVETVSPANPAERAKTELVYATASSPPFGNILQVKEPKNSATTNVTTFFEYGSTPRFYRPTTRKNNLNQATTYHYDGRWRVDSITDPSTNTTSFGFNAADQVTLVTHPQQAGAGHDTRHLTYLYPGGPITGIEDRDAAGLTLRTTSFTRGAEGELLSRTSDGGDVEPVTLAYDALYRVIRVQDGRGKTTHYDYNADNNLWRVRYPLANTSTHFDIVEFGGFDKTGNPAYRIDGRNAQTDYLYATRDDALTDVNYLGGDSIQLEYADPATQVLDPYGRLRRMVDPTGNTVYNYNGLDGITSVATTFLGMTGGAKTVSYTYWPDGSRNTMVTPKGTFVYGQDSAGRLTWLQDPLNNTTLWYYDANGRPTEQYTNDTFYSYRMYNPRGFLTHLENMEFVNWNTVSMYDPMQYDGLGNLKSLSAISSNGTGYDGDTTYEYSPLPALHPYGQLHKEVSNREGTLKTTTFEYDAAFNATKIRNIGVGTPYNDDNQRADTGFAYDGDGNPTTYRGYVGFAYDSENRLVRYPATGPATYEAGYNGLGLRAWKRVDGGPATFFLYDGTELVSELNESGTVTAVNSFGADGLVSRWTSARGSVFYAFDPMGNVAQRLSGNGTVLSQDLYDAFGMRLNAGDTTDPYGWGAQWGYYMDQETGLVLMTHRHYDPATGRFLTRDPIGPAGGINLYAYVENNPVNWIDPEGTQAATATWGGVGSAGASVSAGAVAGAAASATVIGLGVYAVADLWDYVSSGGENTGLLTGIGDAAGDVLGTWLYPDTLPAPTVCPAKGGPSPTSDDFGRNGRPKPQPKPQPKDGEHTKGKRPSTRGKHENAQQRQPPPKSRNDPDWTPKGGKKP